LFGGNHARAHFLRDLSAGAVPSSLANKNICGVEEKDFP
jgi:hypothetical protein